jgi:hypothetical protein
MHSLHWFRLGEHGYFVHVKVIAIKLAVDGDVMTFVTLKSILIVYCIDMLILIGNDDELRAVGFAFLGAFNVAKHLGIRGTLGINDPAANVIVGSGAACAGHDASHAKCYGY